MTSDDLAAEVSHTAAGGNRHPSAADWGPGVLAFGAGVNIAIWNPADPRCRGVSALLRGHTDTVNAIKFNITDSGCHLISGGADKTVRVWKPSHDPSRPSYEQVAVLTEHSASINTISVLPDCDIFVTGAADGTMKIWRLTGAGADLIQSISLKPRMLPLTTALVHLRGGSVTIAVAGTSSTIQLFSRPSEDAEFELQASLAGHEGWIRSLDFVHSGEDILLASASQDKYIRLWRFRSAGDHAGIKLSDVPDAGLAATKKSLSNKAHRVGLETAKFAVTFEALLIGHEDWIYTAKWAPSWTDQSAPRLLSASADNSLAIWQADEASGFWVCNARLGEISSQKGSTTATGSTGGFWIGLWQPDVESVVSLGRTGSWRRWLYDRAVDSWRQQVGISGHTQEVQGVAWSRDGSYLLTTSSDQTTRLLAEWKRDGHVSWHEFARPQIHGYDLNCISSLGVNQFISGADEKLLRVFDKPRAIDHLLTTLSGTPSTVDGTLADAANIPVLGLSNKAVAAVADDEPADGQVNGHADEHQVVAPDSVIHKSTLDIDHPPYEDQLARHTLWPEHEKLYGHGYEISAVAASHDGRLVATACKASSIDHAVIRLYETSEWREVKPALTAHTLTVTALAFSGDDLYLLSVGRDRQWALFERNSKEPTRYAPLIANPKGHTRMILDCDWAPTAAGHVFATAGRDKHVRVWKLADGQAECIANIPAHVSITAVAIHHETILATLLLAYGTDDGCVGIVNLSTNALEVTQQRMLPVHHCSSAAITCLRWRPSVGTGKEEQNLAVASEDGAVRLFRFQT
ncbi:Elongator subunit elp2 [Recurvomyces mirabilis]|uniref:Elongator complex protein 2 n=1 Tax=Recurvomyces mirabilis TaxID=574656 RepID=A0AAE1C6E1_9PEZI|nr:Elongator subunit elp2 [Recurvomyces mirabilis]KAK5162017.1 Elongator subunit elp2 [Recurvomyces mirabilis]